jgi:hypothetical protein
MELWKTQQKLKEGNKKKFIDKNWTITTYVAYTSVNEKVQNNLNS